MRPASIIWWSRCAASDALVIESTYLHVEADLAQGLRPFDGHAGRAAGPRGRREAIDLDARLAPLSRARSAGRSARRFFPKRWWRATSIIFALSKDKTVQRVIDAPAEEEADVAA